MNVTIYKCFIGSPSDTQNEREACKSVIAEINKTIGSKFNFRLETLMWEEDSRPSFGQDGQDVINRQLLLGEYNMFIGMMWSKFGSPTSRAESGTVEEFEDAYRKYKEKKDVEISMYFNKKDVPLAGLDLEQLGKVFDFKKRVSDLGGLYREFNGTEDFKEHLRKNLTQYFLDKHNPGNAIISSEGKVDKDKDAATIIIRERLNKALTMFSGKKPCWIEPILSKTNLISSDYNENFESRINLEELVEAPNSIIIKSPPQFGLTCLSHHLILNAWNRNKTWIYLDATKINRNAIEKEVRNELLSTYNHNNLKEIKCIVLDSWKNTMHGGMKILKGLSNAFKDIPIIAMQTIDANDFFDQPETETIEREFEVMHLLALPKSQIRKIVSSYNKEVYIDEEDKVVNKIVLDMDTLNIHRTPMNCLTLLKVSEKYFDEKTINRTDMLDKVLFILFDLNHLPGYQTRPDVKDCEFVLGVFCEEMLKAERYSFSEKDFTSFAQKICEENYINLDIHVLFDILYSNGIIIEKSAEFTFRARYWILYFAAHRMHASTELCNYIFTSGKYVNYPEIIEFYTGIDRRRTDALIILTNDIKETNEEVHNKLGLPEHIDPYKNIEWNPSYESIEKARNEISETVQMSKLPTQIKDQHSDSTQNQLRPYNQGIHAILEEYSLSVLMRKIRASSRALRNSDYADPEIKKELLDSIVIAYEQVAKALIVLTPELAVEGKAAYAGESFFLDGDFGNTKTDKMNTILQVIPDNVIRFFKDDINSEKLGPLIIEKINKESIPLNKHMLVNLLSQIRPPGWRKVVEQYISKLPKNSFYLFNIMGRLRFIYLYDYVYDTELSELKQLMQLGFSKHTYGDSKPSKFILEKLNQSIFRKEEEK